MGHDVYRDVLDNAPADLTPAERLVLLALADLADESTRECEPTIRVLVHQTGMLVDTIRKAFQRLARRNLDPRVRIGTDRRGRAVFAYEGTATLYRIPRFNPRDNATYQRGPRGGVVLLRKDAQRWDEIPTTEALDVTPADARGGNRGPEWRDDDPSEVGTEGLSGGTTIPPIPCSQDPSSLLTPPSPAVTPHQEEDAPRTAAPEPAQNALLAARGVTADQQRELFRQMSRDGVKNPAAVLKHRATTGQLDAHLAEIRQAGAGLAGAAWRKSLQGKPRCEHEVEGGHETNPLTGKTACRQCQDTSSAAGPTHAIEGGGQPDTNADASSVFPFPVPDARAAARAVAAAASAKPAARRRQRAG